METFKKHKLLAVILIACIFVVTAWILLIKFVFVGQENIYKTKEDCIQHMNPTQRCEMDLNENWHPNLRS